MDVMENLGWQMTGRNHPNRTSLARTPSRQLYNGHNSRTWCNQSALAPFLFPCSEHLQNHCGPVAPGPALLDLILAQATGAPQQDEGRQRITQAAPLRHLD